MYTYTSTVRVSPNSTVKVAGAESIRYKGQRTDSHLRPLYVMVIPPTTETIIDLQALGNSPICLSKNRVFEAQKAETLSDIGFF
jgi:hypothetical protein